MKKKATILVSGMIASDPWQGGATWAVLQYLVGLRKLGHEVYFIETVKKEVLAKAGFQLSGSEQAEYFNLVAHEFDLQDRSALLLEGTRETFGLSYSAMCANAKRADLLINISGMLTDKVMFESVPVRVFLDLDPAFNQLWNWAAGIDMKFCGHTHFVTIGQAIGDDCCPIPTGGLPWIKTFQPIVLEHWPVSEPITWDALTTIANWRSYGSIEYQGILYGQKAHSLRQFASIPKQAREKFILALAIHPNETRDLAILSCNNWQLLDPACVTRTPKQYQQFIQGSWAEFAIAKSGYVASQCGWFSDRSICYLASGRPVLAQETGFSRFLPVGKGLLSFRTIDEILESLRFLRMDYPTHARCARAIANEYFDSNKVLGALLEKLPI